MPSEDMQSKKLAGSKPGPATKRYLDISEIKENVVLLKDGTLRAVLFVSSVNFALKSEDEQNALIQQYVSFLNAIEFPLQVVIQSRKLNIEPYIEMLKEEQKTQENELLKMQIADYRAFVGELVTIGQIMQKRFFVVIPYNPASDTRKNFWSRVSEILVPALSVKLAEEQFQKRREDLMTRAEHISGSLNSMGLKSSMLDTQGLIELYYTVYNPILYEVQPLTDVEKLKVTDNEADV